MNPIKLVVALMAGCSLLCGAESYMIVRLVDPSVREAVVSTGVVIVENPDIRPDEVLVYATDEQLEKLQNEPNVALLYPASLDLVQGIPVHSCTPPKSDLIAEYIMSVGRGWRATGQTAVRLTYSIESITPKLGPERLIDSLERAMAEWSKHVQIDFGRTQNTQARGNLNILFAQGAHGDPFPFDGPRRTLAHTFYPADVNPEPIAGDLHFDEDENWAGGVDPDFFAVALHELGHALGLGHSDRPNAVMYPYYRRFEALLPEDIAAIQRIYAKRASVEPKEEPQAAPAAPVAPPAPSSVSKPVSNDRTAPTLRIVYPSISVLSTSAETTRISGTASDAGGVARVTWSASGGRSGVATGTTNWSIPDLALRPGENTIVVRAYDEAGNSSFRTVSITRR